MSNRVPLAGVVVLCALFAVIGSQLGLLIDRMVSDHTCGAIEVRCERGTLRAASVFTQTPASTIVELENGDRLLVQGDVEIGR